jgi:hypothetical protein
LQPDWNTPAGRALTTLSKAIKQKGLVFRRPIIVFGSAPLQICVDSAFLSADVDVSVPGQGDELKELVEEIGLSKGKAPYYIEVVAEYIFRPGPNSRERAKTITLSDVSFLFPDPLYIQKNGQKSALWENTEKLWPRIYGRAMDARAEIIQPVLDQLAEVGANRDYLDEIRMRLGI